MAEKRVFTVIPTIAGAGTNACAAPFAASNRTIPIAGALQMAAATPLANFQSHTGIVAGDIGIFDAATNLTIAPAALALVGLDFYFAVATDQAVPAGSAAPAGNFLIRKTKAIDIATVTSVTNVGFVCAEPKVITLSGFTAECDTEYCIKIRYESEVIKQTYGYQDLVKTYTYTTSCCGEDCACPDGDCAELAYGIAKAVNDDPDNLVTAVAYKAGAVAIVEADFNTGIPCTDITVVFTGETGSFFDGCGPNPMVKDFANTDFYIGLTCGFECNGTLTDTNTIIFEEGLGEQVQSLEEYADGYSRKFGIYRIPFPRTVANKLADAGVGYDLVTISYNDVHDSAHPAGQVASTEKVIVAVDSTDAGNVAVSFT
jgi:hypothetical protein